MKTLTVLLALLSIPLGLMNIFGGIGSGIWLACLGEWRIIGLGLLVGFFGMLPISIALMPTLLFALPISKIIERGNTTIGFTLLIPAALYTVAVMAGWCYLVFAVAYDLAAERHSIPILLWSYGVATGPWTYMASKEDRGSEVGASTVYAFFISFAYLLMVLMRIIGGAEFSTCFSALIIVMLVALMAVTVTASSAFSAVRVSKTSCATSDTQHYLRICEEFESAFKSITPHIERAKRRKDFSEANELLTIPGQGEKSIDAYEAALMELHPDSFKSYTPSELLAFTKEAASLTSSFERLTALYEPESQVVEGMRVSTDLYRSYTEDYSEAVNAFSQAAADAATTAREQESDFVNGGIASRLISDKAERDRQLSEAKQLGQFAKAAQALVKGYIEKVEIAELRIERAMKSQNLRGS